MGANIIGYQDNFCDEIIVDSFAGGGGASTGIEFALGRIVDVAINHDPAAVTMHRVNHWYTHHYREDIWQLDPRAVVQGRRVALLWGSPDCKHFSRAKGAVPVSKKIRGLAWSMCWWAATVHPRVIILENVPEFTTWGPIKDGKPIKEKAGKTFRSFVHELEIRGYTVEWRVLKACDFGAPTIRKRFYMIARCDGQPIIWPEATHGLGLKPYHTAGECIDNSIPCPSIFTRKKGLATATMQRVARGIEKFVVKSASPYIVQVNHSGNSFRGQPITEPMQTITAKLGYGVVKPKLKPFIMHNNTNNAPAEISEPLHTITTGNRIYLASPQLRPYRIETNTTEPELAAVHIGKYFSGKNQAGSSANAPIGTVTAIDHNAVTSAFLAKFPNSKNLKAATGADVSAKTGERAEVKTYRMKYQAGVRLKYWPEIRAILNEFCEDYIADDEIIILEIDGVPYYLADIGLRMLTPRELFLAQGFPPDYVIDIESVIGKKYSKAKQVARCGNAVCPPVATALVAANLAELAVKKVILTMAALQKVYQRRMRL